MTAHSSLKNLPFFWGVRRRHEDLATRAYVFPRDPQPEQVTQKSISRAIRHIQLLSDHGHNNDIHSPKNI
jgi:hypothetical protein